MPILRSAPLVIAAMLLVTHRIPGQDPVTILEGSTSGTLSVRVVDARRPAAGGRLVKAAIRIRPIETTNRTVQYALHADLARRVRRGGLTYLELPGRRRLLAYRDPAARSTGLLLVGGDGRARVVLERPSSAPNAPLEDVLSVSPGGEYAVAPTTSHGLVAVRLDGGTYASTGSPARDLATRGEVVPESVLAGARCVFYQTDDDRVWRCGLADLETPEDVTPGLGRGSEIEERMAISGDGRVAAFLAGPDDRTLPWLLFEQGPAVRVEAMAREYLEPKYLPEDSDGPWLMLNDDGSRLLFVEKGAPREFHLVDTGRPTQPIHITNDTLFHTCVGIGILPAFVGDTLLVALGHRDEHDWYAVRTTGVRNLTLTTPILRPWYPGQLAPRAAHVLDSGHMFVVEQRLGGLPYLRDLDPRGARSTVLVENVRGGLELGETLDGAADVTVHTAGGDLVLSATGRVVLRAPAGIRLSRTLVAPGRAFRAFSARLPNGNDLAVFLLPDGSLVARDCGFLRQIVLTPRGLLLNGTSLDYYAPGRHSRLSTGGGWRWVISGAGS